MDKKIIIDKMRQHYPNIRILKKFFSDIRIIEKKRFLLSENERIRCELDDKYRDEFIDKRIKKYKKKLKKLDEKILDVISRKYTKHQQIEIYKDVWFCFFAYGFQPDEYVSFNLRDKSRDDRISYISDVERYIYGFKMNDIASIHIFVNKWYAYDRLKKYYKREAIKISGKRDYESYIRFVKKHPRFVLKNVFGAMGKDVSLIDFSLNNQDKDAIFEHISKDGFWIAEEVVKQSNYMAKLNSSSVNTIRCITLNVRNNIVVAYCFMKAGRNGSFVDNAGAGGIVVGVDCESGICGTDGFDEMCNRYYEHPETRVVFKGFQLPNWGEMIEMCKTMASLFSEVRFIGWDMAHTDIGWVVIEANGMSQFIIPQLVWERGIKKEVVAYMDEMGLKSK